MNKATMLSVSAAIVAVLFLPPGTSFAAMIVGTATGSWGTVTVTRGGSNIPFVIGMDLEDGDVIKTERRSGAVYELYDISGVPILREEIFGLPGPKGCADAEGDRGEGEVLIRGKNRDGKRRLISEVQKGTIKGETKPGHELEAKLEEIIAKKGIVRKKGTEYAITYDLGSDLTSLSTLDGLIAFDNIEYATLPDIYFTDPLNKSDDTLDLGFILGLTSDTVSVSDLLGAGNSVNVSGGYYSLVASAPSAPLPGLAPIHSLPGGLSPEPASIGLMMLGGVAMFKRRRM